MISPVEERSLLNCVDKDGLNHCFFIRHDYLSGNNYCSMNMHDPFERDDLEFIIPCKYRFLESELKELIDSGGIS